MLLRRVDQSFDNDNSPELYPPDYIHIMVVTRLARDGWDWMMKFTDSKNSLLTGVYNSHWMVVDYAKFLRRKAHESLAPFTFMVLETAPGASQWSDMTTKLMTDTWWGSFNVPYFPEVKAALNENPDADYTQHTRYRVFAGKQKTVDSLEKMKLVMRAAGDEEVLDGRSVHVGFGSNICARPDLAGGFSLVGGADSKVVSAGMMTAGEGGEPLSLAINGPSTVGNGKPFSFKDYPTKRHQGIKDVMDWGW